MERTRNLAILLAWRALSNARYQNACGPQSVKIKNFSEEVRAGRDVDRFLSQAAVLLDLPSRSLESTLCHMLQSVLEDSACAELRDARCSLLKRALFTDMAQASLHGTGWWLLFALELNAAWRKMPKWLACQPCNKCTRG